MKDLKRVGRRTDIAQLLSMLQQRLDAIRHKMQFEFVREGVRRDNDWWYVPVLALRNGNEVAREFTVNVYANIEDEFEQQHGVSVLFVPVINEPAGH